MTELTELDELISLNIELGNVLSTNRNLISTGEEHFDRDWLIGYYIWRELEEAHLLLDLIASALVELQKNSELRYSGNFEEKTYRRDNLEDLEYMRLIDQHSCLVKIIPLHIRSTYLRLYNVDDLLKKSKKINKTISREVKKELTRILLYRHRIIVHKNPITIMSSGLRYGKNGKFEIMPASFISDESRLRVNLLFDEVRSGLSLEDNQENDLHEKLKILYMRYNDLNRLQRKQFEGLMAELGVISAQPYELASIVLQIARIVDGLSLESQGKGLAPPLKK